ncbi:unnamed protein product [Adineta steineri]|uniref:Uncharacterized protein n=1 Tax=Adineta steineri TaxID=433720 RepID=A0A820QDB0_9BILA|nr:unnamed protein product [Adineta steineri]
MLCFFLTFILTDCLIISGIWVSVYANGLPMGYAYSCFNISICFSIIDGICSLRRLISNWPENELLLYNHSADQVVYIDCSSAESRQRSMSSSNSITCNTTYV